MTVSNDAKTSTSYEADVKVEEYVEPSIQDASVAGPKKVEEVYNADLAAAVANTDLNPWSARSFKVCLYDNR